MERRIRRGLELLGASWRVLRADRELLLLPLLSALLMTAVVGIVGFRLLHGHPAEMRSGASVHLTGAEILTMAVVGFALVYLVLFFNVALICAADQRMCGEEPTLVGALRDALTHARAIVPWAGASVGVGLVLGEIERRLGFVGRIIGSALGFAWAIATYLVLPIIVLEEVGLREALRRSRILIARTWGEAATGEVGISTVVALVNVVAVSVLILVATSRSVGFGAVLTVGVLWFLLQWATVSALGTIFRVAVYRYATDGCPPPGFEQVGLDRAFTQKRGWGTGA